MLSLTLSVYKYLNKRCWLALELLIFFLAQDIIDRVFFDVKVWSINDTIILGLISIQYIIKIYDNTTKNTKLNLVE